VPDLIRVRNARQHNLKGVSVDLPRRAITVVTGPSGSGKSSLAFDTIYAEGQRRYVESLSAYARQFLERMQKPLVDSIDGLSPAVAIEQKNPVRTSRSTVGTATEIYDYLRLLWARIGRTLCPDCQRELRPDTPQDAADQVLALPPGTRLLVAFPLRLSDLVSHAVAVENLRAEGFVRVVADGVALHVDDLANGTPDLTACREVLVVADRLTADPATRTRLTDAIETAFREGDGDCVVVLDAPTSDPPSTVHRPPSAAQRLHFTTRFECPEHHQRAPQPTPQLFSFNNPRGACPKCNGFGATLEYDLALIVPHPERALREGAIDPWTKPRYDNKRRALAEACKREGIPMDRAWRDLSDRQREFLLRGRTKGFQGILRHLVALEEKKYKQYIRVFLRQYQSAMTCPACHGAKLQPEALNVRVGGHTIADVAAMPVDLLNAWLDALALTPSEQAIAAHIWREARERVRFLCDVGLTYLTLDRATRTLSGGEAQRIGLANSLGSRLVDALYVLDEPSIGLHPRDMDRLLRLLARLRDGGNTVLVVEHDLEAVRHADWMLELGPESGERGGRVVYNGPVAGAGADSLTGQYLTGARSIALPERRRTPRRWVTLEGARAHNLRDVDLKLPLGVMTAVTGVSGSGKSTLVHDVFFHALEAALTGEHSAALHLGETIGEFRRLAGHEALEAVVLIDQEPIGRSPRSNPVTYVKAYDEIRRIFAALPEARARRYTPGTFSFNVKGGRCEKCEGAGALAVEMVFLADVFVPCEECEGKRFKPDVLGVKYFGRSIVDVLEMTVDEAIRFFPYEEKLGQALWHVQQVGLGYLRLGQPATTLSGGEAQRLKIARELAMSAKRAGHKLYLLDEPTTGLHLEDIRKLAWVLDQLVEAGHTVVLIEHNLDVIKLADWVVDLGPEGGEAGGRIIATGTPEQVADVDASHTGRWLRSVLPAASDAARP
jgi:excinuclease ABC subunit A